MIKDFGVKNQITIIQINDTSSAFMKCLIWPPLQSAMNTLMNKFLPPNKPYSALFGTAIMPLSWVKISHLVKFHICQSLLMEIHCDHARSPKIKAATLSVLGQCITNKLRPVNLMFHNLS